MSDKNEKKVVAESLEGESLSPSSKWEWQPTKRRSLVVFVYSLKQLKNLKRFGSIQYVSRKMKYVVLYMDEDKTTEGIDKIQRLHFVRHVERSHRPDIATDYSQFDLRETLAEHLHENPFGNEEYWEEAPVV